MARATVRDQAVRDAAGAVPAPPPTGTPSPHSGGLRDVEVSAPHPDYTDRAGEWATMRDCARGASAVEAGGELYLPMPTGFSAQDDKGAGMYASYAARAQFPELVGPTVRGMMGVVHRQEARVDLPQELEYLWEDADGDGTPLEALHQRVTEQVLVTARVALLPDAPAEGGEPRIKLYHAEALINWSPERDFFVLSECGLVREGFAWRDRERHRVLQLAPRDADPGGQGGSGEPVYRQVTYNHQGVAGQPVVPVALGGAPMTEIPLVVVGARDLAVSPDDPPLLGVARSALAIYRLDADYRHQLFMTGQETLFVVGASAQTMPTVVGAGVVVALPQDARAEYVGPSGVGIDAHRQAIQDERDRAAALGARVFDTNEKASAESGEALRIRRAATTATLVTIAQASAKGLEAAIRHCGRMLGLSEERLEEVVVAPNLDFAAEGLTPAAAKDLVTVWQAGAISYETLYENLQRGGIASPERTAEEEQELVAQEGPEGAGFAGEDGGDPAEGALLPDDPAADDEGPPPGEADALAAELFDPSYLAT